MLPLSLRFTLFPYTTLFRSLVKLPWLFTAALAPVSVPPKLLAKMLSPLVVDRKSTRLNSSNVAISYAVFGLTKKISWANVPLTVLVPPSCSVRPPSSPKPVELNAAPPCAIVVPDPLCVPPDRSEEHTSELQSRGHIGRRLLLEITNQAVEVLTPNVPQRTG